ADGDIAADGRADDGERTTVGDATAGTCIASIYGVHAVVAEDGVRDREGAIVPNATTTAGAGAGGRGVVANDGIREGQRAAVADTAPIGARPFGDGQTRDGYTERRVNAEHRGRVAAAHRDHKGPGTRDG